MLATVPANRETAAVWALCTAVNAARNSVPITPNTGASTAGPVAAVAAAATATSPAMDPAVDENACIPAATAEISVTGSPRLLEPLDPRREIPTSIFDATEARSVPTIILGSMETHVVEHPLAAALLTRMRDERSDNATFRSALRQLTHMLVYEATRDAAIETFDVKTPVAVTNGTRLSKPPLLVPVLRAGLGMVEKASGLIPQSRVGFVGMARDEQTHQPVPYMESLPDDLSTTPVYVLDPMLATGGSMVHTIELLVERGAADVTCICVVAAPEGVAALEASGLPVRLVAASIDDGLNEDAFIVPGLGDAGDRQFGPR